VAVAADARKLEPGSAVTLGVRPEHLVIGGEGHGVGLAARVVHVERLGESSLVYADVMAGDAPGPTLAVRIEGHAGEAVGQAITLRLRPEALHLFDADGAACRRSVVLPR
jgi:multiple sugar transport system ATP-binding protein